MEMKSNGSVKSGAQRNARAARPTHEFEQQCLRVLRCTAMALANSPGGLRFKVGTQPSWLDALSECHSKLSIPIQNG